MILKFGLIKRLLFNSILEQNKKFEFRIQKKSLIMCTFTDLVNAKMHYLIKGFVYLTLY